MSRLLIVNGVQEGRVLRLRPGLNRLGRSVENHIQIPDPSVSGAHCEVILSETSLRVRDLNSTNGTFVDGEPVREAEIIEGQTLQLGNIVMRVEMAAAGQPGPAISIPEVAVAEPPKSATLPDGSLACANHPEVRADYRCTKCGAALCEPCVRIIHRIAGDTMVFCSVCSGACEFVGQAPAPELAQPEVPKKNLLGRLRETLKPSFKRPGK